MPSPRSSHYKPEDPVTALPLVGPQYAKKLERLEIFTIRDLIQHYPHRYQDTQEIISIAELKDRGEGTVQVVVEGITNTRTRARKWLTKATLSDETGSIPAVWFNQPYLTKTIKADNTYLMHGKTTSKWGLNLVNPQYEQVDEDEMTHLGKLTPVYPETYGVSSKWLRARLKLLRDWIPELISDFIPEDIRDKMKLLPLAEASQKIHFPEGDSDVEAARDRIGLNELIDIQIQVQKTLKNRQGKKAIAIEANSSTSEIKELLDSLEFKLTKAQEKAVSDILEDLNQTTPMYRLLNGDVGSGKTIVALAAAVGTFASGHSTIIMAPTTILANQHFQTITRMIENANLDIPVRLLTSDHQDLIDEAPQIIVGTHAILFKQQLPENTALVVVDEQHRFGVAQRKKLIKLAAPKKDDMKVHPHYLTMTATPIPRTLTMALYGTTNVSVLDELPPGRKPVKTNLVPETKRKDAYDWIDQKVEEGEQVFAIYPLVEDSEKIEAKAATEEFKKLERVFSRRNFGLVHGQLPEKEKQATLQQFKDHKLDILVATPVIEVGIDIPNATVMIIEDAERFGLAQLHQFRGRIGRGDRQAYCFLFTESDNPDTLERLEFFCKNNSGFKVAEYDLKRRGPGEVYGLRQSGILNLRFADISDPKQIALAQEVAKELVERGIELPRRYTEATNNSTKG